jgi:hypothetical protein
MNNVLLKIIEKLVRLAICLFLMTVRISLKPLLPKQLAKIVLIKVQPCSAFLLMLLACNHSCLKSFLEYEFLILDTYHPDILLA